MPATPLYFAKKIPGTPATLPTPPTGGPKLTVTLMVMSPRITNPKTTLKTTSDSTSSPRLRNKMSRLLSIIVPIAAAAGVAAAIVIEHRAHQQQLAQQQLSEQQSAQIAQFTVENTRLSNAVAQTA